MTIDFSERVNLSESTNPAYQSYCHRSTAQLMEFYYKIVIV